ncbi:amidohydrolase family protein [Peribacillus frigoritolerans]|uniref:amidohydrolase family protein n=1 Tax=Peribacillus frigoritolerans TaxID=450367 RepID=UPI001059D7F8|nr:amidohydrolase family protein [Peribacillus frigoritolerans]TDL82670.1 amidohydrolase [Peribacillus frigoritolerans]
MKIIDAHMHISKIQSFKQTAETLSFVDYSIAGLQKEYEAEGVVAAIAMGVTETKPGAFPDRDAETPMGIDLDGPVPNEFFYCPGINPNKVNEQNLLLLEKSLQNPQTAGIKIYLGYYPYYAYDKVYGPVYELAKAYRLPVVFHTGDTYSERGLLKYSHPLTLDEVAVENRDIQFMMAHLGDPWVLDGAEVVNKNDNMFADLSGLIVGTAKDISDKKQSRFFDHLLHALSYCEHYEKLLFGTDWPLIGVKPFVDLYKDIIPDEHHENFFYKNALRLFPKLNMVLKEDS